MDQELIELLAEKEHISWSKWMDYILSTGTLNKDGSVTFSKERVSGWKRQIVTPYTLLSEEEKQYDRDEVYHILPIIEARRDPCQ